MNKSEDNEKKPPQVLKMSNSDTVIVQMGWASLGWFVFCRWFFFLPSLVVQDGLFPRTLSYPVL